MSDEHQPDGALNTEHEGNSPVPYDRFSEVIKERNDLKSRLAKLEKAQADADQKRLEEEQRYQELAEKLKAELATIQPIAGQVEEWRATVRETAAAQVAQLPEDMRDLVPEFDDPRQTLAWLNKNAAKLMRPLAANLDAGARGDSPTKPIKLTPGQEAAARAAGMTPDQYAAALLKMDAARPREK